MTLWEQRGLLAEPLRRGYERRWHHGAGARKYNHLRDAVRAMFEVDADGEGSPREAIFPRGGRGGERRGAAQLGAPPPLHLRRCLPPGLRGRPPAGVHGRGRPQPPRVHQGGRRGLPHGDDPHYDPALAFGGEDGAGADGAGDGTEAADAAPVSLGEGGLGLEPMCDYRYEHQVGTLK